MQKKRVLGWIGIMFLVGFLFVSLAEAENLVENLLKNPGFEEGLEGWMVPPPDWGSGKNVRDPVIDESVVQGPGHVSLKMIGEEGKRGCILQSVVCNPKIKRYKISGWMKTKDFENAWIARIVVHCTGKGGKWLACFLVQTSHRVPDTDWERFEREFEVPEETTSLQIRLETYHASGKLVEVNRGTAWFDNISFEESGSMSEEVSIHRVYPEGEKGLFLPDQPVEFTLKAKNSYPQEQEVALKTITKDFHDKIVYQKEETLKLKPLSVSEHQIMLPAQKDLGFYSLNVTFKKDDLPISKKVSSFCVVSPSETNDPFFGVTPWRVTRYMAKAIRMIGVGTKPEHGSWGDIENEKGRYDWTKMDKAVDFSLKKGFRVFGFVMNQQPEVSHPWLTPLWAREEVKERREKGQEPYPEEYFQRYSKFVEKMVNRYKDRIHLWYLMNEINIPMRDKTKAEEAMEYYIKMVKAFSDGARKADPDCRIAGVGVSGFGETNVYPPYPVSRKIWARVDPYLDGFWPHPYAGPRGFGHGYRVQIPESFLRKALLDALDVIRPYGKSSIGISENGYALRTDLPVDSPYAREMAKLTARTLIIARSVPEMEYIGYHTTNPADEGSFTYGLWELLGGGSLANVQRGVVGEPAWPRPVVAAYATVAKFLNNVTEPKEINPHKDIYAYAFKKDNGSVIALWTILKEPVSFLINFPKDAALYNLMGNKVKRLSKGTNELILTDSPIFIVSGQSHDKLTRAVNKGSFSLPLIKAEAKLINLKTFLFDLINQTNRELKAEIELEPLKGTTFITKEKEVIIPAKKRLQVEFNLKDTEISLLNKSTLSAKVTSEGRTIRIRRFLDLFPVVHSKEKINIDGNLSEYQNISPVVIDNPNFITPVDVIPAGLWTGPDDLSFKVWLTYDEKYFYFAASVTDDKFVQQETGGMIWQNDSLMLAFDTRNDALSPKVGGRQGYDANDYEFAIALTGKGPECYCWNAAEERKELGRKLMDFPIAIKKVNKITTNYELAIPLKALLPLKPEKGRAFGFNFLYLDKDSPGKGSGPYWMGLTPGIHGGKDPSAYKTFILLP